MVYGSVWKVSGKITKMTTLTSKKNEKWRGYLVEVATLGDKLEIGVHAHEFAGLSEGMEVEISGQFEKYGNRLQLSARTFKDADGKPLTFKLAA